MTNITKMAVYKSGTGTWGRVWGYFGRGTRDEGLEDISVGRGDMWDGGRGTRGLQTQGHRGRRDDNDY